MFALALYLDHNVQILNPVNICDPVCFAAWTRGCPSGCLFRKFTMKLTGKAYSSVRSGAVPPVVPPASCAIVRARVFTPRSRSAGVACSSGWWLSPSLHGMKTIAVGATCTAAVPPELKGRELRQSSRHLQSRSGLLWGPRPPTEGEASGMPGATNCCCTCLAPLLALERNGL